MKKTNKKVVENSTFRVKPKYFFRRFFGFLFSQEEIFEEETERFIKEKQEYMQKRKAEEERMEKKKLSKK